MYINKIIKINDQKAVKYGPEIEEIFCVFGQNFLYGNIFLINHFNKKKPYKKSLILIINIFIQRLGN